MRLELTCSKCTTRCYDNVCQDCKLEEILLQAAASNNKENIASSSSSAAQSSCVTSKNSPRKYKARYATPKKRFQCSKCKIKFPKYTLLTDHQKRMHGKTSPPTLSFASESQNTIPFAEENKVVFKEEDNQQQQQQQ